MPDTQVTKSFWNGVITIVSVIVGALYVSDKVSSVIDEKLSPLSTRVIYLEKQIKLTNTMLNANVSRSKINSQTICKMIDFINKKYNTNFSSPSEFFEKPEEVKIEDNE